MDEARGRAPIVLCDVTQVDGVSFALTSGLRSIRLCCQSRVCRLRGFVTEKYSSNVCISVEKEEIKSRVNNNPR